MQLATIRRGSSEGSTDLSTARMGAGHALLGVDATYLAVLSRSVTVWQGGWLRIPIIEAGSD
ncbi:hypothetical protein CQW39_22910 [Streptomyces griseofuscus]|nr:hypothetical protein CQW39_22910 [Streptomyces griseofuscus]